MEENQYVKEINGYLVKDAEAREDIAEINTTISGEGGLDARLDALEDAVGDSTSGLIKDVDDLEITVGDNTAGLVKDVDDLETTIGDSSSGLVKNVNDVQSAITTINNKLAIMNNAIKLSLGTDYVIAANQTYEVLSLTNTDAQSGSALIKENGKVKIGAGVHHILVSGEVYWYNIGNNIVNKNSEIYKNETIITNNDVYGAANYLHGTLPAALVAVQQNDIISLRVSGEEGDVIKAYNSGTYLNVVVLD